MRLEEYRYYTRFYGMMKGSDSKPGKAFSCLILEDDEAFATMTASVVRSQGGEVSVAGTVRAAREFAAHRSFDLYLLDNHLPDGRGYELFEEVTRKSPETPVVMITGIPDLGEAVSLTRNGLFDYLTKPLDAAKLEDCLQRAKIRLQAQSFSNSGGDNEWFGTSPLMLAVDQQLRQAARHATGTVLLAGETGTGKEVAARRLHRWSFPQGSAPFIAVNCGAVPADMFEAELFGAERGAYTGADKKRVGLAAAAAGGTLFLDELAEVPLSLQSKLLRLIEAREFRPLGSVEDQAFKGRFLAATNKDLKGEVQAGRFREDLLYRFDVFTIVLPPLRLRASDIPGLAELLITNLSAKYHRAKPMINEADLKALNQHSWPGNVRELRNVLERSLLKTPEDSRWLRLDLNALQTSQPQAITSQESPAEPISRNLSPIEREEYRLIRETLGQTNGGIRRAAARLGMSPQALLRRLEKWPELRDSEESKTVPKTERAQRQS